jgi:hypothetical protein
MRRPPRNLTRTVLIGLTAFAAACTSGAISVETLDAGGGGGRPDASGGDQDAGAPDPEADGGGGEDAGVDPGPPPEASGNDLNQAALFVCDGAPGASPGRIRRVGREEWTRNVGRNAGSDASRNPFDPLPTHDYSTFSADETLDESVLDIHLDTVSSGTYGWATRERYRANALASNVREDSIACMYDDSGRPDDACVRTWVTYVLERGVLFRPPRDDERDALVAFTEAALDEEAAQGLTRQRTLERAISAAWMTTGALFRTELGEGEPDAAGRRRLGPWELANAIAYALDGRAAGAPGVYARFGLEWSAEYEGHMPMIRQAAIDGTIHDPEVIAQIVRAYFGGEDPERVDLNLDVRDERRITRRGEFWLAKNVRAFFREWLGYTALTNIFKDTPGETSAFGEGVTNDYGNLVSGFYGYEPTLIEQMDDYIARVVAADRDVVHELFTNRRYYTPATAEFEGSNIANSTLETNAIYNLTQRTESTREARWIELPATERAGVLTHPAFLASHALAFENDPNVVHRGKWIRERVLCSDVPDLPITVDAAFDPDTRDQSARQRMREQVDERLICTFDADGNPRSDCPEAERTNPYCQGCHTLMNPLGYPFEIYNHAGYLRAEDHGGPPDGSAVLVSMPDPALNGPVRDAVEMSERFADSQYVKRCFIRQSFRHFSGREEVAADACALAAMEQAYDTSGGAFSEMLIALFTSDAFQYRIDEGAQP